MIDRLEELLAMLEDEDEEEEEREDILDLTAPTASPEGNAGETSAGGGGGGRRDDPAAPGGGEAEDSAGEITDGGGIAPIRSPDLTLAEKTGRSADDAAGGDGGVPARALKRFAGEMADINGAASAKEPERSGGETADEEDSAAEEEPEAGLIWRLDAGAAQRAETAWRRATDRPDGAAAEAVRMTAEGTMGTAAKRRSAETGGELARVVRHEAERGLEGLYRQTAQAIRPGFQALPVEQAGRTVRAEEPGRTAAFTVGELDRAVRRDSRRYDGGMTIF